MEILEFILHLEVYLEQIMQTYPEWFYLILFLVIFIETGLVVLPFLPGDSLLFATGALAASFPSSINIFLALIILFAAAVLGDTLNYSIGKYFGKRLIHLTFSGRRLIKDEHIKKTEQFFDTYGAKTIVIARFVPIVRTLAPFVAGITAMHYRTFIRFNLIGGIVWVFGITLLGYFLGNLPIVQENFKYVVVAIIIFSLFPVIIEWIKNRKRH